MSRGLGKLQRDILAILQKSGRPMLAQSVAWELHNGDLEVKITRGSSVLPGHPLSSKPQLLSRWDPFRNLDTDLLNLPIFSVGNSFLSSEYSLLEGNGHLIENVLPPLRHSSHVLIRSSAEEVSKVESTPPRSELPFPLTPKEV